MIQPTFTKASMLKYLKPIIKNAKILDFLIFKTKDFLVNSTLIKEDISSTFPSTPLIVRSSSSNEDQSNTSNAGKFDSVLGVTKENLNEAINKVINSYGVSKFSEEEVLVQPMLEDVDISGVMFTHCQKSGAPYYIINYNKTGDTTAVTSGTNESQTLLIYHEAEAYPSNFKKLVNLAQELIHTLRNTSLDIEFAFNKKGDLFLFQVRPITASAKEIKSSAIKKHLESIKNSFNSYAKKHPYLYGSRTFFGIMPDWNPAEIIGVKPRPLALSLYKELITDGTWAYQRDNYGYRNLRSFPLLVDFCGLPYIDVRVSFNSFIPKEIPDELGEKIINYYLNQLEKKPYLHDKIEFDIVFSCYTFNLQKKLQSLKKYSFSDEEIEVFYKALRNLTNAIIHEKEGLWSKDIEKINTLIGHHNQIFDNKDFNPLEKIYWLIADCKRYGTLPFAGLARAAFIAVQMLQSMVDMDILSKEDKLSFLNSLDSISSTMTRDFNAFSREDFLKKYGHLRPGTYDILSKRYDEAPDDYFDWKEKSQDAYAKQDQFKLSISQMNKINSLLKDNGLELDVISLFSFMKAAIEGREYSKFIFTKSLSNVLLLLKQYGLQNSLSLEDLSFLDIKDLIRTYSSTYNALDAVKDSIKKGKEKHIITESILLPPLLTHDTQLESFSLPEAHPNFITKNKVTADVIPNINQSNSLKNKIVFITNADPGFDWIFTKNIAGFVTAYGGINSHMSIRAAELNVPAIIGAGEKLYNQWSQSSKLHINCEERRVEIIH
jgi:phosphoenolpyruvate synthase/pyruvate phosphate dikinase